VIDGSSQMYRAYHAIRGLTGPDGRSTNAVYGFVTMLRKLIEEHRPTAVVAAFDLAGPTFRSEMAADYKANRAPMPPDLIEQVPWVHRACEALGVPIVTCEGFEADDVIATIANRAGDAGYQVVIVTGDKDLLQLVRDTIVVLNPRDEGIWYDAEGVRKRFGVPPERVVDVLALMGDAIDNIKGVPGIGEKGAIDLISTYGSLDELLGRASEVAQKKYREALLSHAEARQSRELASVRTVPVAFDLETFRYRGPVREAAFALFSSLGFRSLLPEFAPGADSVHRDYRIVGSPDALASLAQELGRAGRFAFRIIASDSSTMQAGIVGIALSVAPRQARYVPVAHAGLEPEGQLPLSRVLDVLAPLFADPGLEKVGHDVKPDSIVLARHGVALAGVSFDTMLASYLLDATRAEHPLEALALEHLGYRALTGEEVCGSGAKALSFAEVPAAAALDFAGERSDLALQLAAVLDGKLRAEELEPVFRDLEMPLLSVLADVEQAGIRVDAGVLGSLSQRIERELAALSAQVYELAGGTFNQLAHSSRCFRSPEAARSGARARRRWRRRPSRCSRSWRSRTSCRVRFWSGAGSRSSRAPTSTRCPRS
jgi:DNA polymerase-1